MRLRRSGFQPARWSFRAHSAVASVRIARLA
jgi:hypothetical protein